MLLHGDITKRILGAFFRVHTALGHGYLEVVYRRAMVDALRLADLEVATEVPFSVTFEGRVVGDYRADIVVENKVIVECKAGDHLSTAHEAQLINYLRASGIPVGVLLNFGSRATFRRLICSSKERPL